ncbi:MAG: hypothetical protein HY579_02030 [Nitrospinae bacterium]|nr:hypothetical protein [Nitrospinota bacterium]
MGFVLLLGLCAYILLARVVIRLLMRIPKEARNKRIVLYLSIFTAILIPIWDVPLIDWKFNQLCKTEAGIHVYEKAVLGPEYWNEDGTLKFLHALDLKKALPGEFELASMLEREFDSFSGSSRGRLQVKRKKNQKIIGEEIYIWRGRNWLVRWIGGTGPGVVCSSPETYTRIVEAVFKQKSD